MNQVAAGEFELKLLDGEEPKNSGSVNKEEEGLKYDADGFVISDPLNAVQINYAKFRIQARHALRETPIQITWPWLRYICCCCYGKPKRSFKYALKRSIRNELGIPETNNDRNLEADPFLVLGMGMNEYYNIMKKMITFFLLLTIMIAPFCYYFSQFLGLDGSKYFFLTKYNGSAVMKLIQVPP